MVEILKLFEKWFSLKSAGFAIREPDSAEEHRKRRLLEKLATSARDQKKS
jgi:hypothetical protein